MHYPARLRARVIECFHHVTLYDIIVEVVCNLHADYVQTMAGGILRLSSKKEKLALISSLDPFLLTNSSSSPGLATSARLPLVEASDIVAYLVLQTSFLTTKQFKAHKSLESYNYFVSGWDKDVKAWKVDEKDEKVVVAGRVSILLD